MASRNLQEFLTTVSTEDAVVETLPPECVESEVPVQMDAIQMGIASFRKQVDVDHVQIEAVQHEVTALEGFTDFLRSALTQGGINQETANALNLGLESFEALRAQLPEPSCFGGSMSKEAATKASVEAFEGRLREVYAKAKELLKQLIAGLKDTYVRLTANVDQCLGKTDALLKEVGTLRGEPSRESISVSGIKALTIDGKVVLDDFGNLQYILEGVNTLTTQYWFKALDKLAKIMTHTAGEDWDSSDYEEFLKVNIEFDRFIDGNDAGDGWVHSRPAQGNRALFYHRGKIEVKIDEVPGLAEATVDSLPVNAPGNLRVRLTKIQALLRKVQGYDNSGDRYKSALDQFYTIFNRIESESEGDPDAQRLVNYVTREMSMLATYSTKEVPGVTQYALQVLSAALAVTEREIKAYQAPQTQARTQALPA